MDAVLKNEVRRRFGVFPNFFRLASTEPEITANLWGFAKFAYLDNPLPYLFKERLFVYLSRFCEVRYCVARHLGFRTASPAASSSEGGRDAAAIYGLCRPRESACSFSNAGFSQ
jgi:hypothetical protein